ncbi:MAG: hypothetical protein LUO84_06115, partial [Methanomassiliicoccales archaeon]|nr:hypothetical protein [Methanomassiliicoccales archaeon]
HRSLSVLNPTVGSMRKVLRIIYPFHHAISDSGFAGYGESKYEVDTLFLRRNTQIPSTTGLE